MGLWLFQLNKEENLQLTKAIMELLYDWGIRPEDQIRLLGLPATTKARHMQNFGNTKAFPEEPDILTRIEHLMGIAEALRTTYPLNEQMGKLWLHQPHRRFDQQPPILCMLNEGIDGLIAVRCHLDCAYDWQRDQEHAKK